MRYVGLLRALLYSYMGRDRRERKMCHGVFMAMRICSLLPSATEIVCALGLRDELVAVTHECDYPLDISSLPAVTSSVVDSNTLSSRGIDSAIRQALENLSTIYFLDRERLERLHPDLILTQELCQVCAVSFDRVRDAARTACPGAEVISLEPQSLSGIFESIDAVARRAGVAQRGQDVVDALQGRVDRVRTASQRIVQRPRVLALEWLDPLFIAGHWVPEMIDVAGCQDVLGLAGQPSREITWEEAARADPDTIILMPCGFDLERTVNEFETVPRPPEWSQLRAVQSQSVYAVNGSAYFNRPGPRIVDGIETLARIAHPELFGVPNAVEAVRI